AAKKKRMGRPLKAEGKPRAKIRSFRLRPELDQKLIAAAQKAGRTVSDEIEFRLEQSFEMKEMQAAMTATISQTISEAILTSPGMLDYLRPELARARQAAEQETRRRLDRLNDLESKKGEKK